MRHRIGAVSAQGALGLFGAAMLVVWLGLAWLASRAGPVTPAEPARSADGPRSVSVQREADASRPDGRKPLVPTEITAEELNYPPLSLLSGDQLALAMAVLNFTTGACDPCQAEGLSMAACLRQAPPGCENMPRLLDRVVRGAASGAEVNAVRASVRYDDSWLPVPNTERPGRGAASPRVRMLVAVDYLSPFTAEADRALDALLQRYDGALRVELLQAPRAERRAREAAEAALAAAEAGCFWEAHRALAAMGPQDAPLPQAEAACGAPLAGHQEAARAALKADLATASALGVRGTPTAFINGYRFRGLRETAEYGRWIELELADGAVNP